MTTADAIKLLNLLYKTLPKSRQYGLYRQYNELLEFIKSSGPYVSPTVKDETKNGS